MPYPVDPQFPVTDEDRDLLAELDAVPVRPVFIMGLHRSGTTFLYDCMARSFPVAQLTLYHLFYYRRLLRNHIDGSADADRARLNACFRALDIRDRAIDQVPVNAEEVEEYGFLLRRLSGGFKLNEATAEPFAQMCRKLLVLEPQAQAQAVLLKNPWDTGNAHWILERFPDARFVYITREPISVLNSMLNALLSYLEGPQRYLEMLLSTDGSRRGYRVGYAAWKLLRGLRRVIGKNAMARCMRGPLARSLAQQVAIYRKEVASLPADRAVELDYRELVANPHQVMERLARLLDLPLNADVPELTVRRRSQLNPALENFDTRLQKLLGRAARV